MPLPSTTSQSLLTTRHALNGQVLILHNTSAPPSSRKPPVNLHPLKLRLVKPCIILERKKILRKTIHPSLRSYDVSGFSISFLRPPKSVSLLLTYNYAMEALNAASLTPISVLGDRKKEPRKFPSLPAISLPKFSNSPSLSTTPQASQECLSRSFHGGLLLLSSVFNTGFAKASTYEEALGQSVSTSTGGDLEASGILDDVTAFVTENPAVIAGGFAILAVPLVLFQVLKPPKPWGVDTARNAYAKLGDDANAQLLDIRSPAEFRQVGTPDVRGLGKKSVPIVYKGEDKPRFLKKLSLKFKEPENTTLFVLDK